MTPEQNRNSNRSHNSCSAAGRRKFEHINIYTMSNSTPKKHITTTQTPLGPPKPIEGLPRRSSSANGQVNISNLAESSSQTPAQGSTYDDDQLAQSKGNTIAMLRNRDSNFCLSNNIDPAARAPPDNWEIGQDAWPTRSNLSFTRSLIFYGDGSADPEQIRAAKYVQEARDLRTKYHGLRGVTSKLMSHGIESDAKQLRCAFGPDGVMEIYNDVNDSNAKNKDANLVTVPSITEFCCDYSRLVEIANDGAMRSFCFQRLQMLSCAFKMHKTANASVENNEISNLLGTDFYRTMKVDNHIHLAAAASAKQFLYFVRNKLETEGDTVVLEDGQTLKDVFRNAGLDMDHLTIDGFNVLADYSVYQRFDNFNSKYSPFRLAQMRKIFLKVDNVIQGRYFAELTKMVLSRHEAGKGHNSAAEMRLSIYGMERDEWLKLAKWVLNDWEGGAFPGPVLSSHNRWIIQVPRLWRIYCKKGSSDRSFQDMLDNLFTPLFEATLHPDYHPEISELLMHIVAFDSVDDEGLPEAVCCADRPADWKDETNPAYSWQLYYLWANIEVLNQLRKVKGLNTFAFRPHAGETGDIMHLAASYVLCESINHGILLDDQVSLQYLYYLDQIGLSISPLSNNFLFCKIRSNPFPKLFQRGLNVTLSTDDPMLFHMSDDALLEEYSVARASFDLSLTDISELARNSVLQAGFEDSWKRQWLGDNYARGVTFCDEHKTHVPLIRAKFRSEHLALELMYVSLLAAGKGEDVLQEMMMQFSSARDAHRKVMIDSFLEVPFNL